MVRGGSWNNNRDNARCAYRNDNDPGNRNNNIGFRVVRGSHIVQSFERQAPGLAGASRAPGNVPGDHGRRAEAKELRMAQASPVRTDGPPEPTPSGAYRTGAPPGREPRGAPP